jgi:hypothetical protein
MIFNLHFIATQIAQGGLFSSPSFNSGKSIYTHFGGLPILILSLGFVFIETKDPHIYINSMRSVNFLILAQTILGHLYLRIFRYNFNAYNFELQFYLKHFHMEYKNGETL